MDDLIKRLEVLSAPCRETDRAIHSLIDPERFAYFNNEYAKGVTELMGMGGDAWEARKLSLYEHSYPSPTYTASIDSAMTLVPEGWSVHCHFMPREMGNAVKVGTKEGEGKTPAIALCIAALRARRWVWR